MELDIKKLAALAGAVILGIVVIVSTLMSGGKKASPDAYATITSVPGVKFVVNKPFYEKATAITQISEGLHFERNGFYSYKNGKDQYLLFNLDGFVLAVQKGTRFDFAQNGKNADALNNSSIVGIWLKQDGRKFKCKTNKKETTAVVDAGVVITNDLYNDFAGKMKVIKAADGTEYSMFVGVPASRYKDLSKSAKEAVEIMIDNFVLADIVEQEQQDYAVTISSDSLASLDTKESISENAVMEDESALLEPEEVPETSVSTGSAPKPETTVSQAEPPLPDTGHTDEPKEDTEHDEDPSGSVTASFGNSNEGSGVTPASPAPAPDVTEGINVSNERQMQKQDTTKAYTSDVYSMLVVGITGLAEIAAPENADTVGVRPTRILDADATKAVIREAYDQGMSPYPYNEPPVGCHWEAVEYDVNYSLTEDIPYVNVKLTGLDGEALRYRGIKYSTMTHDLDTETFDGNWGNGYITFYPVPNGCTEYVLKFGDGTEGNGLLAAYYRIVNDSGF